MSEENNRIIFFDGVCNLCNRSVQIVLRNDKQKIYRFAALQSEFAQQFFAAHQFVRKTDSIVLFDNGRFYTESTAGLRVAVRLRFPYPLFGALFIFPAFLRDPVYRWIARNRYKWFGRRDSCMIPGPDTAARFLG